MGIGTGIAIAGIWLFPAACAMSKTVTGIGFFMGIAIASIATWAVLAHAH